MTFSFLYNRIATLINIWFHSTQHKIKMIHFFLEDIFIYDLGLSVYIESSIMNSWLFEFTNIIKIFNSSEVKTQALKRTLISEWMSKWVFHLTTNDQIFSYFMARTSCIQWDDDVRCVLHQHSYLDFHSASALRQQSEGRATHSDALSCLRANPSLLFLLNDLCLV